MDPGREVKELSVRNVHLGTRRRVEPSVADISDDPREPMDREIRRQVDEAIGEADLMLFVLSAGPPSPSLRLTPSCLI